MNFAIIGKGRMGALIKDTLEAKGHHVVGNADAFDKAAVLDHLDEIDGILDFSHRDNLAWVLEAIQGKDIFLVEGTTGYDDSHKEALKAASAGNPIFFAANYSLGIALMQELLKAAAGVLRDKWDMEIVETHHNQKNDAPSGTALALLKALDPDDSFEHVYGRQGFTGARGHEIGIHALRGGSVPGDHEVLFLGPDERLCISHSANSRQIFVNGAVEAAQFMAGKPAGMYGMPDLIAQ